MNAEEFFLEWKIENKDKFGDYGDYNSDKYAIAFAEDYSKHKKESVSELQSTKTVTESLTGWNKYRVYLTVLIVLLLFAPSLWVFVKTDTPGFWKWKYLGSFLYAIGWNLSVVSAGCIMNFFYRRMNKLYIFLVSQQKERVIIDPEMDHWIEFLQKSKSFLQLASYSCVFMATFYFMFNVMPMSKDTILPLYISILVGSSVISVFLFILTEQISKLQHLK